MFKIWISQMGLLLEALGLLLTVLLFSMFWHETASFFMKIHSYVQLYATLWTVASQAPLSMGILQARILEWVAMSSSRGSFWPRNQTGVSCIAGEFFTSWATRFLHIPHITALVCGSFSETESLFLEPIMMVNESFLASIRSERLQVIPVLGEALALVEKWYHTDFGQFKGVQMNILCLSYFHLIFFIII